MFNRTKQLIDKDEFKQQKLVGESKMRKDSGQPTQGARSMIGTKVVIKGDLFSEEDLTINGEVEGTVTAKNNEIHVGAAGKLKAIVRAKNARVEGAVDGEIHCSECALITATANVKGTIVAPRVILEDGAKFKGSIDMDGAAKSAVTPPASAKPAEPVKQPV